MTQKTTTKTKNAPLRLEQYETVLYNANLNPLGVPPSVFKALSENLSNVIRYPSDYYGKLKTAISDYAGCSAEHIILGSGFADLLHLFTALLAPKKAMIPIPSCSEYERTLSIFGCETDFFPLSEADSYVLDVSELITKLDSSYDMLILGNPNNPTSQIIPADDLETLAEACRQLDIFLVIDEMYIEFTEQYEDLTAVPLVMHYDNIAVIRSISKFFAVPGLRLAYAIMNNPEHMAVINMTAIPNSISTLTAAACIEMFSDNRYIDETRSQIYTERNLIYSAMASSKKIKLYKPYANFMLAKILKTDVTAGILAANCSLKGIVLRNCSNIRGLDEQYIRFCFMNPKQNDLLVNTILEQLS